MGNKKGKTREIDDFIDEAEAVSATEMTGLIGSFPLDEAQEENYLDILHYKAKGSGKNGKRGG